MSENKKLPRRRAISEAEIDAEERALERAVQDPKLIEGVYNYCDRWCERCPLTARCLLFKLDRGRPARRGAGSSERQSQDLHNEEFWDELATSFALAMRVIRREAKKRGIDFDAPGALANAEETARARREHAAREGRVLHRSAVAYIKTAKALMDRLPEEMAEIEQALATQVRLGAGNPHAVAAEIRDAWQVVQWYLWMVDVKLQRAFSSRVSHALEAPGTSTRDADGSAKVALIAIDRSIAAWARLRSHFSGEADAILDLLVQLDRLRHAAERDFPHARAFKRPGFD
ncbi:MAG: hypothetical protein Q7S40_23195 [Opitutaceae bacterium]|nr:hypothetical protein [Opitutaceae bacterium]